MQLYLTFRRLIVKYGCSMYKKRPFWIQKIKQLWDKRPIVWLTGVRRVGKTTLTKMLPDAVYLNCDLPSVNRRLQDPETFFDLQPKDAIVIFDEIHRLADPSLILKIAADSYPYLKILATGSSTLSATKKFRDSLTGRKHTLFLPPVLWNECASVFNKKDLDHRFLYGGLPESLLANTIDAQFFSEWIDSFFARDIQELFKIRNREGFIKLFHLILLQSGGLLSYTNLAKHSGLSRPTVSSHIEAIKISNALFLLPPFHSGNRREIIQQPKCYGFDTGFVAFLKGWETIREDDRGLLWEHLVLDTLRVFFNENNLYYWRDKSNREIDFIIRDGQEVHTLECKINPDSYDVKTLLKFRSLYPKGKNFIISPNIKVPYQIKANNINCTFCSIDNFPLIKDLSGNNGEKP